MTDWLGLNHEEERIAEAFMSKVAALPVDPGMAPGVVDPMQLWWKAQLLRRWDAERRVQMPLDVMDRIEVAAGLLAAGVLLVLALPSLTRILAASLLGGAG